MKQIMLIIPNLDFGGAQLSFSKLSMELGKHFSVVNVVFNKDRAVDYNFSGKLVSLKIPASSNYLTKIYYFIKRVFKVKNLKKNHSIDVSISFLEGADYVNLLSKRREKVILSIRGSKFKDENIKGLLGWIRLNILMPAFYKKADSITTVNEGIKKEISRFFPQERITTIYNVYDIHDIKSKANENLPYKLQNINSENVIVSIGRLSNEKGFHHLIKVFELVKRVKTSVKLIIIGSGPLEKKLINLCQKSNLTLDAEAFGRKKINNPDVIFLGYLPNPFPVLKIAKIFALCSSAEGFPNVLIEAMSLSVPVISTDCPYGPNEILNKNMEVRKNGQLLKAEFGLLGPQFHEKNSYQKWSDSVIEILENKELHSSYSMLSKKRAMDFSNDTLLTQWESLILN